MKSLLTVCIGNICRSPMPECDTRARTWIDGILKITKPEQQPT